MDIAGDYLAFAAQANDTDAATRAVPSMQFRVQNLPTNYVQHSSYNRNSQLSLQSGLNAGILLTGLSVNDSVEVYNDRLGTVTTAITAVHSQFAMIRLDSIFHTDLQQIHYRWRNDDAGEATATWAEAEDTAVTDYTKNTTKRLRVEISNEGSASGSVQYRLEVSQANPITCEDGANTWTRVDSSTHWNMATSTQFADGDPTTDVASGLTNENTLFKAGQMKESTDETSGITLNGNEFTEIEYALTATSSTIGGATYCFRLTDAGAGTDFTYIETKYGKETLGADLIFDFRKSITINRSKIPGSCGPTVSNFPVLYSVTDPSLATTTYGGNVTDAQGDDIVFRALDAATCSPDEEPCRLDHEIEKYDETTGELVAWVRVPVLNTSAAGSDTVIYVYYGSSDITSSNQNIREVWDANYVMAQHLQETSGTHFDSTGSIPANDGTNSGSNQNATGKMDGANDFLDSGEIRITDIESLDIVGPVTVEAWVKLNNLAATSDSIVAKSDIGNDGRSYGLYFDVDVPKFFFSVDGTAGTNMTLPPKTSPS